MYLTMAVETAFADQAHLFGSATLSGQAFCAESLAGMLCVGMTALAQVGDADLEKVWLRGAVRVMAVSTIIAHRCVLPQKGTSFFRVTAIAGFTDRSGFEKTGTFSAVGLMAIRTFFGAISARHHRVASMFCLSAFGLMASEAYSLWHCVARGV